MLVKDKVLSHVEMLTVTFELLKDEAERLLAASALTSDEYCGAAASDISAEGWVNSRVATSSVPEEGRVDSRGWAGLSEATDMLWFRDKLLSLPAAEGTFA